MGLKPDALSDEEFLNQVAGITGFGWTASTLGFLGSIAGYGNSLLSALVVGPRSLLYLGIGCFLATLGLDRLRNALIEDDEAEPSPR